MTTSSQTGRSIPKRDPQRAADALAHAEYKCEFNNNDRTFPRKNGNPYTWTAMLRLRTSTNGLWRNLKSS